MGKDKFGTKRGKCVLCKDCKEYTKPSNDSQSCDYCDHKPVYHIEVIPLGTCSSCDCDGYTSSECVYDDCEYCACPAQNHKGWDKVQMEVEKIKNRSAKPTGAIESVMTKDIHASPQHIINPSAILIPAPQPHVDCGGGLLGFNNPPTQLQYPKMGGAVPHGTNYGDQAQPNTAAQYPHGSQGALRVDQFGQPFRQQLQQPQPPQQPQLQPQPQFQPQPPQQPQFQPQPPFQQQTGYTPAGQGMQPHYQQPPQGYPQQHGNINPQSMPQKPPSSASQSGGYGVYFGNGSAGSGGGGGGGAERCKNPKCDRSKRPKEDGSGFYDFCGKTCAKLF